MITPAYHYQFARRNAWRNRQLTRALDGDLNGIYAVPDRDFTTPRALCVTHMFNHATHYRGQVHAMMTRTGLPAPVSDLIFMPEDV